MNLSILLLEKLLILAAAKLQNNITCLSTENSQTSIKTSRREFEINCMPYYQLSTSISLAIIWCNYQCDLSILLNKFTNLIFGILFLYIFPIFSTFIHEMTFN